MQSNRLLRVGEEIKKILAVVLNSQLEEYRGKFLTLTEVRVSKDLSYADVWISVMGGEAVQKSTLVQLNADAGKLRHQLAGKIYLRHLPELRFSLDATLAYAEKIDRLLESSGVSFNQDGNDGTDPR